MTRRAKDKPYLASGKVWAFLAATPGQGYTIKRIANEVGCSQSYVRRVALTQGEVPEGGFVVVSKKPRPDPLLIAFLPKGSEPARCEFERCDSEAECCYCADPGRVFNQDRGHLRCFPECKGA